MGSRSRIVSTSLTNSILVILAGGASSRMKTAKALLKFGDKTLLDFMLDKFSAKFMDVYVASSQRYSDVPHIPDLWAVRHGPVGAIISTILYFGDKSNYSLTFIPVDMPYFSLDEIDALNLATHEVCYFIGSPLPIKICVSPQIILSCQNIAYQLANGESYSVKRFMQEISSDVIELTTVNQNSLKNINYPEEWEEFCNENSI